jgi:hypothetical protein
VHDLVLFDSALTGISFVSKLRKDPRTGLTSLVALSSDPARTYIAPLIFKEIAADIVKLCTIHDEAANSLKESAR